MLAATAGLSTATAQETINLEPAWTRVSSPWESGARQVTLGGDGSRVAVVQSPFSSERREYSTFQTSGAAQQEVVLGESVQRQELSSASDAALGAWYRLVQTGSGYQYQARISVYELGSESQSWEYVFPFDPGIADGGVKVSSDGTRVVAWVYNPHIFRTSLVLLDGASGQVLSSHNVNTSGRPNVCDITADGSLALLSTIARAFVIDTASGSVLYSKIFVMGHGGLALSPDGSTLALSDSTNGVWFLRRQGGTYNQFASIPDLPDFICARTAFSTDGSTVALSWENSATRRALRLGILQVNATSLTTLHDETFHSSADVQLVMTSLRLNATGDRLVMAHWGDGDTNVLPELLVYGREDNGQAWTRTHERNLPGSVVSLDVSTDGSVIVASSSDSHVNLGGAGARLNCFDLTPRRFEFEGNARIGETITFRVRGRSLDHGHLLTSATKAPTPLEFPGIGTLYLKRSALSFSSRQQGGTDGWIEFQHTIPNDPALVGTKLYAQGLTLSTRSLTDDFIELTIAD
ncbi:hypothetical protein DRQ53_13625 [bacterium]|nr:MAG: hypothetical protein DRQ53_13625 [bacterium]